MWDVLPLRNRDQPSSPCVSITSGSLFQEVEWGESEAQFWHCLPEAVVLWVPLYSVPCADILQSEIMCYLIVPLFHLPFQFLASSHRCIFWPSHQTTFPNCFQHVALLQQSYYSKEQDRAPMSHQPHSTRVHCHGYLGSCSSCLKVNRQRCKNHPNFLKIISKTKHQPKHIWNKPLSPLILRPKLLKDDEA